MDDFCLYIKLLSNIEHFFLYLESSHNPKRRVVRKIDVNFYHLGKFVNDYMCNDCIAKHLYLNVF